MLNPKLQQYENAAAAWAQAHPAVRAVIIGGSSVRQVGVPGDQWSDLDLEVYVTDFAPFETDTSWLTGFGHVWIHLQLTEDDAPVTLVVYEGGEKVDFHFSKVEVLEHFVVAVRLPDSCVRGYRVLVDKDGLAARLPPPSEHPRIAMPPTREMFAWEVNTFWYGALYSAKQIRRRNLWVVKRGDVRLKNNLLKMLEWHAQSQHGWQYDTWHDGHFVSQWVDASSFAELTQTYGGYEARDCWSTLVATMRLFGRLAREVATQIGAAYPITLDQQVSHLVQDLFEGDASLVRGNKNGH